MLACMKLVSPHRDIAIYSLKRNIDRLPKNLSRAILARYMVGKRAGRMLQLAIRVDPQTFRESL
jgi:hypothetical protein